MLHKNIFDAFDEGGSSNPKQSKKKNKKKSNKQPLPELIQGAEKVVEKPKQEGGNNQKQPQKPKGVSAEPHPLDRRSGTGMGKEPKKQGGGGLNWGTYKDELKMEDSADKHDLFKETPKKQEIQEDKPQKTLDEYYTEQSWIVVGNKGQDKGKEEQQIQKKEMEIEKMIQEEHLEIVKNKKEEEKVQETETKKKKRHKKKKQTNDVKA